MSEMERKVFKQTYHLDNSDSESSGEDEYIYGTDGVAKDEVEKIIASYKSSLESGKGQQIDTYDGDASEEPKLKTLQYKRTYRTPSKQQSSLEASCDDEPNEDKEISYKTIYRTLKENESCSEALCDDDDPDYEPKEKKIKGYGMKHKMSNEWKSCPEILSENDSNEEPRTASIKKLKKSSVELQPTPGAEYIVIPIPNYNNPKFNQKYREEWEKEPYLKDWIQPWLEDSMYAYCRFCKCKLAAHKKSLRDHSNTKKHRRNAFDITGIWGTSSSKPANLTFLVPRSRVKTEEILTNDYDSSSLSFANSSDFNMRVINDPLLPISS